MSEYQYYEFLAVDCPLTAKEIEQVRCFSSRADISATRFVNEYNWGDFRGDEDEFLARWFDVMLYVANWGTQRLMLALPAPDPAQLRAWRRFRYEAGLEIRTRDGRVILDFCSELEEPEEWPEGSGWMASLAPVREELLGGDERPLFLGWLAAVGADSEADDDGAAPLPPVPAGLADLTPAEQTLAEFLRVDADLLAVAASHSAAREPAIDELASWIAALPQDEKDQILLAAARGEAPHVGMQLRRRYQSTRRPRGGGGGGAAAADDDDDAPDGTVRDWLRAAKAMREARESAERERRQRESERRAAERAARRETHLADLTRRQDAAWTEVDGLVAMKNPEAYDQAVALVRDLREIAVRQQSLDAFAARLAALRAAHARKVNLLTKLRRAGVLKE